MVKALQLGPLSVWPPVVLAPMAGVTNYPFRRLCHELGAPLTVSEMVTARSFVARQKKSLKIAEFGPDEPIRSLQLYGVDPTLMAEAVKLAVNLLQVDHIDLNFGCPVKKVMSRGGGAALPYKRRLFQAIIQQAVCAAGSVPVTVKFRLGLDDQHLTYLDAGYIAQEEGAVAVGLHARTAEQLYSGKADWTKIAELKALLKIPVLGNGDIFSGQDALNMMQQTHCDGVIIGRGCLGKPWLFTDLKKVFEQTANCSKAQLSDVMPIIQKHLDYMIAWFGEALGIRSFRKHLIWYCKGFDVLESAKSLLLAAKSVEELTALLHSIPLVGEYHQDDNWVHNEKARHAQKISVPYGYLDSRDDYVIPDEGAESETSGG